MLESTSYSSAPTAPSLPEMDSISTSLRVRATGSMSALQDKWLNQISPRRHGENRESEACYCDLLKPIFRSVSSVFISGKVLVFSVPSHLRGRFWFFC